MIMKLKILVMLYEYQYWYVQLPLLPLVDDDLLFIGIHAVYLSNFVYILKNILDWELYFLDLC